MEVHISPYYERFIQRQIETGPYHSPEDVISEALAAFERLKACPPEEYDQMREAEERELERVFQELSEEVAKGFASGMAEPQTLEEFLEECKRDKAAGIVYGPPL